MSRPVFPKAILGERSHLNAQNGKAENVNKLLSFQELHKQLQARLQSQGVINDMRAELRNRLVQELYEIAEPDQPQKIVSDQVAESQLPLQISNWLVCNHFQRGKFEFTLSTFLRESGIVTLPEYNMTFHDVLYIFGIHPQTELYKTIRERYSSEKNSGGLLFFIIQELLLCILPLSMKSYSTASTQTDSPLLNEEKLHLKVLHEVEYLREKLDEEIKGALLEKVKQENMRKDFVCISCSKQKQDGLSLLDSQTKEIERLEDLLKFAENDLKKQKENMEQEILSRTQGIEDRLISQWRSREGDLKNAENRLQKNAKKIEEESLALEEAKVNSEKSQFKIKEMEVQLELLREQTIIHQKQNKSLQNMLESMADYEVLKSDLSVTKRELELALSRYQETQNQWLTIKDGLEKKIAELTLKITSPCLELLTANSEVQKMLEKHEQDQINWNDERKHLQKDLNLAKLQIEEQRHHISNLNKVIHGFQLQLSSSQLDSSPSHLVFTSSKIPNSSDPPQTSHFTPGITRYHISSSTSSSSESRVSFLQQAKRRIEKLQEEADILEKKYGQFLHNQQSLFSPSESFFSPFVSTPRILFSNRNLTSNHLSFAGGDLNFPTSTVPKPFFHDDHNLFSTYPKVEDLPSTLTDHLQESLTTQVSDLRTQQKEAKSTNRVTSMANMAPVYVSQIQNTDHNLRSSENIPYVNNPVSLHTDGNTNDLQKHKKASLVKNQTYEPNSVTDFKPQTNVSSSTLKNRSQLSKVLSNSNTPLSYEVKPLEGIHDMKSAVSTEPITLPKTSYSVHTSNIVNESPRAAATSELLLNETLVSHSSPVTSKAENQSSDNEKASVSKLSTQYPAVNLDEEWKNYSLSFTGPTVLPSLVSPSVVNLDAEWKKLRTGTTEEVKHHHSEGEEEEASHSAVKSVIDPEISASRRESNGNINTVQENRNCDNKELHQEGQEEPDNEIEAKSVNEQSSSSLADKQTQNSDVPLDPTQAQVLIMDEPYTTAKDIEPVLSSQDHQDLSDASQNEKSDIEINLSIGDQGVQSGNSNSESMW